MWRLLIKPGLIRNNNYRYQNEDFLIVLYFIDSEEEHFLNFNSSNLVSKSHQEFAFLLTAPCPKDSRTKGLVCLFSTHETITEGWWINRRSWLYLELIDYVLSLLTMCWAYWLCVELIGYILSLCKVSPHIKGIIGSTEASECHICQSNSESNVVKVSHLP